MIGSLRGLLVRITLRTELELSVWASCSPIAQVLTRRIRQTGRTRFAYGINLERSETKVWIKSQVAYWFLLSLNITVITLDIKKFLLAFVNCEL